LVEAYGEHGAVDTGTGVIECGEDDRGAELPFVDEIFCDLIIAIEAMVRPGTITC
jgi:hypothetical protein